jgi:hypothetical protein
VTLYIATWLLPDLITLITHSKIMLSGLHVKYFCTYAKVSTPPIAVNSPVASRGSSLAPCYFLVTSSLFPLKLDELIECSHFYSDIIFIKDRALYCFCYELHLTVFRNTKLFSAFTKGQRP